MRFIKCHQPLLIISRLDNHSRPLYVKNETPIVYEADKHLCFASFAEFLDDIITRRAKDLAERRPKNNIHTSTGAVISTTQ